MKAKHHFWSSLAAGGALWAYTGTATPLAGAMIGGFLIDSDHVLDQAWSIYMRAPLLSSAVHMQADVTRPRGFVTRFLRRRKLIRLPLIFHSYELLLALLTFAVIYRTPFIIGLVTGYITHIALDLIRHYHEFRSPFFYFISYRLAHRFRRDKLIKVDHL